MAILTIALENIKFSKRLLACAEVPCNKSSPERGQPLLSADQSKDNQGSLNEVGHPSVTRFWAMQAVETALYCSAGQQN
jgi:hypothetical protein